MVTERYPIRVKPCVPAGGIRKLFYIVTQLKAAIANSSGMADSIFPVPYSGFSGLGTQAINLPVKPEPNGPASILPIGKVRWRYLSPLAAIRSEIEISWLFIKSNWYDAILPCLAAFLASWLSGPQQRIGLPLGMFWSLVYSVLFIYTFCVYTQGFSINEDRINKPYRPLASGAATVRGTCIRLFVGNVLFLAAGSYLSILAFSASWIVLTILYTHVLSKHWLTKNLVFISMGTWIIFGGQWGIARPGLPMPESVKIQFLLLSLWFGLWILMQDMRDQDGDRVANRKTLPLQIGDRKARLVISLILLTVSPILYALAVIAHSWALDPRSHLASVIVLCIGTAYQWYAAFRIWRYRTSESDKSVYKEFAIFGCASIAIIPLL